MVHSPRTCVITDCPACAVHRRIESLHFDLREVESEIRWKLLAARWTQLVFRGLLSMFFAHKIHREMTTQCSGASKYQWWRIAVLQDQRRSLLVEVTDLEYVLVSLEFPTLNFLGQRTQHDASTASSSSDVGPSRPRRSNPAPDI